jgi:hypothetical protein
MNKFLENKTKNAVLSLSLILLLSLPLMMTLAQPTSAQVGVPQPEKTVGFISVAPLLVGVGQEATVNLWLYPLPSNYVWQPYFKGFDGITVTFVKPDGSKDTFMPVDGTGQYVAGQTQALGAIYFTYKPGIAGNWSVSFTMPAQNLTDNTGTVQYQACTSNTAYFTVQTDHVNAGLLDGYPWAQLPNSNVYWSYPINANNREWSQISGDWLGSSTQGSNVNTPTCRLWQPYGSAPNTAHIVWKQQLRAGGIIGGEYGSISYAASSSNAVIMNGKVYVNIPNTSPAQFECIDQTTGKVLFNATGSINNGIHLPGDAHTQANLDPSVLLASSYGSTPTGYLLGITSTAWNYYDPLTGALTRSIVNATSASIANASNPSYYAYQSSSYYNSYKLVDGTNLAYGVYRGTMYAWDMSKVVNNNWPTGIIWTKQLPLPIANRSLMLIGTSTDSSTLLIRSNPCQYWGYSAKDGSLLWGPVTLDYAGLVNEQITLYGVDDFIVFDPVAVTFHCYSINTGKQLWESQSYADSPWATTWTVYGAETNDLNNFYLAFCDGTMAALSLADGHEVWRSKAFASTEYPNNAIPYVIGMIMAGGNIYGYAGYSTSYQIDPVPRFAMLTCTNATTGEVTYTLNGGVYPVAAANGYVIGFGIFDGTLYCKGKGQTTTSVTIQNDVVNSGATALIKGNVFDKSPISIGTPAVSDASMSEQMDYLHMQNATLLNNPPKEVGVSVTLTAVDPNGNPVTIGTTTTDSAGYYALNFVPDKVGIYTVTATFAGTNGYFSSNSETKLSVVAPVTTTATSNQISVGATSTDTLLMALIGGVIAIIITIIAIGIALVKTRRA